MGFSLCSCCQRTDMSWSSASSTLSPLRPLSKPPNPIFSDQSCSSRSGKTLRLHHVPKSRKTVSFHTGSPSYRPHSPFDPLPLRPFPKLQCSGSLQNSTAPENSLSVLKSWAKKIAVLVFGSAIIVGIFRCRPVVGISGRQRWSAAAVATEERDEDECAKLLEGDSSDVDALKMALYEKMKKKKTADALKYLDRLIDIEPDEVEWRLLQALSYELMGQLGKAKKIFKEILEERPLLLRALHGLALVMHKKHEGVAVFEMLTNALELARREQRIIEERNIQILIAQMHVVKGDFEAGLKLFKELVAENPRDFRPFLCQGIIYSLLDKKQEAEAQFEIYRSLVPEEFPQRGFLDDIMLAAKTESHEKLQKEFDSEFSAKNDGTTS